LTRSLPGHWSVCRFSTEWRPANGSKLFQVVRIVVHLFCRWPGIQRNGCSSSATAAAAAAAAGAVTESEPQIFIGNQSTVLRAAKRTNVTARRACSVAQEAETCAAMMDFVIKISLTVLRLAVMEVFGEAGRPLVCEVSGKGDPH